jgi:tetratricopeptide (TPR) repeat protein
MHVLRQDVVPEDRRTPFYRLLTDRLQAMVASIGSDPDSSRGFVVGDDYIYPAEELASWRRLTVDYLIRRGQTAEAARLLDAIENEQLESRGQLRNVDDSALDYAWVDLARATVALKSNQKDAALAAARRYASLDAGGDTLPDREAAETAASVLRANGAQAEADALLEQVYRTLVDLRQYDDANFTGLAGVLYRRSRPDEADGVLRRLAARRGDSPAALEAAADAAASNGRISVAIELRQSAARIARADSRNALELARLQAAAGDAAGGAVALGGVVADERAPASVRAQAVDLAAELAASNASARSALSTRLASAKTSTERVLAALVAASGGDASGGRSALESLAATDSTPLSAVELGRMEMAAGRTAQATAAFEKALSIDPRDALAQTIAFGGVTPLDGLARLYTAGGRYDAALKLAETHADRYQKGSDADGEGAAAASLVFEGGGGEPGTANGLPSLSDRNFEARQRGLFDALASLADAAAKLGRWVEAIDYQQTRLASARPSSPEQAGVEAKLGELRQARADAERRAAGRLTVGTAVASERVVIRDFTFD